MSDETTEDPPKPTRSPRDNRKINSGVAVMEKGVQKTYAGTDLETLDALEKVLTPEMLERFTKSGVLEGDWTPGGKPPEPMQNSRLAKAARSNTPDPHLAALEAENATLHERLAALESSLGQTPAEHPRKSKRGG